MIKQLYAFDKTVKKLRKDNDFFIREIKQLRKKAGNLYDDLCLIEKLN